MPAKPSSHAGGGGGPRQRAQRDRVDHHVLAVRPESPEPGLVPTSRRGRPSPSTATEKRVKSSGSLSATRTRQVDHDEHARRRYRTVPDVVECRPCPTSASVTRTRWPPPSRAGWPPSPTTGPRPRSSTSRPPPSNGFSNETILCRTRSAGGAERRLVVRVAPTKHLLFLDAEFSTQYRAMRALADGGSAVPLPTLGSYEEDPQYLGVPFFTMDHVEGLVPSDNIPYTLEGWVIEATPEQQERMWWSGIDALAAVHRTDWRALGLEWLGEPRPGQARARAAAVLLPGLPRLGHQGGGGAR